MILVEQHHLDPDGNPAGGYTAGEGIPKFALHVRWQDGPLGRGAERKLPNGAFVEDVIRAALGRLQFYQTTKFRCFENELAITRLKEALHWCQYRTADRERRGVEGTHEI